MKGLDLINALKKKLGASTDSELAQHLGNSVPAIHNWKKRQTVTIRQVVGLIDSARTSSEAATQRGAIRPIVEFFPIDKHISNGAGKCTLFAIKSGDGAKHPYLGGLRKELENHSGVYVFFDSRGQAIYTGKARRQNLWTEMNLAFNRNRGAVQSIKRVAHPSRKQTYRTSNEKARQIRDQVVSLHELAAYFSAYEVVDGMINELEALLVRSSANDLLNIRMERFGHQQKARGV